jgi:hypothetical protein
MYVLCLLEMLVVLTTFFSRLTVRVGRFMPPLRILRSRRLTRALLFFVYTSYSMSPFFGFFCSLVNFL